ncbi:hypothetical protein ACVPPR_07365 [Dellaglioa sp. L3N]
MNKQERKTKKIEEWNQLKIEMTKLGAYEDIDDLIHVINSSSISYDECTKLKYQLTRMINLKMKGGPVL